MKKTKRYEDGGYLLDSEGKRVKSGSGEDIQTGSYDKEADMESARKKLAQDVQNKLKADKAAKDDADFAEADRMSSTARAVAGKPASNAAPSAKAKSGIVTKEELAKSGLTLREYMNKQQGKTARGSSTTEKAPSKTTPKAKPASTPAVSGSYRSEGAGKAKPSTSSDGAPATKKPTYETPLDRYGRKKAEDEAKTKSERQEYSKKLASDPAQIAIKKERDTKDTRSASERSADRGRSIKEFFGINTKKPLDPKGAVIQSMDTDVMRTGSRTAAKEAGKKRMEESESDFKKGGSVRGAGIAQRGVRKCKMV